MVFVVKWLPRSGIPASKSFAERSAALDYACALIKAREKDVELYETGRRIPGRKLKDYCAGNPRALDGAG